VALRPQIYIYIYIYGGSLRAAKELLQPIGYNKHLEGGKVLGTVVTGALKFISNQLY